MQIVIWMLFWGLWNAMCGAGYVLGFAVLCSVLCAWHTAVLTQPSIFLVLQKHTGMPSGVAVPTAIPGTRISLSSLCVMSATTSLCGTIVASDSSDP